MPNKKLTTKFCKLLAEAAEAVKTEETPQFKVPQDKGVKNFKVSNGTETVLPTTANGKKELNGGSVKLSPEAEEVMNSIPEADTFRMMAATLQNMVISNAEHEKAKKAKKPHITIEETETGGENLDEAATTANNSNNTSKT